MSIVISHVPKTAGTSLIHSLKKHFKKVLVDRNLFNHDLVVEQKPKEFYQGFDIYYGHSVPNYIHNLSGYKFCMFFRDPVDRVCSHFLMYQRLYGNRPLDKIPDNAARKAVTHKSILQYSKETWNTYKYYSCGKSVDQMDMIGFASDSDQYSKSVRLFNKIFNVNLEVMNMNTAPKKINYVKYLKDQGCYEEVVASQKDNYERYNEALVVFERMCKEHGIY